MVEYLGLNRSLRVGSHPDKGHTRPSRTGAEKIHRESECKAGSVSRPRNNHTHGAALRAGPAPTRKRASVMTPARSTEALRGCRKNLFEAFPHEPTPASALRYQELLAEEILRTEAEQRRQRSPAAKRHLRLLRIYGDSLAHSLLSRYAIRQLSRNAGHPPALTGQGQAFSLVLEGARGIAATNICPLIADLTRSIRNGDLIACSDPHLPQIIECKSSEPKHERYDRQGRRGRQSARRESIGKFLGDGHGLIFGETRPRSTLETRRLPEYSWAIIDDVVKLALRHKPVALDPDPGELISAACVGESTDASAAIARMEVVQGDHVMVGSTLNTLSRGPSDVPPPMNWGVSLDSRWALMEEEVSVTHAFRLEALIGFTRGEVRITRVIETPDRIPWRYEAAVGDELVTFSATNARDIVYCHHTTASAGWAAVDIARGAVRLFGSA